MTTVGDCIQNSCGVGRCHQAGRLLACNPTEGGNLVIDAKLTCDCSTPKHQGDDVAFHVLIDARDVSRLHLEAGFLVDLTAEAVLDGLAAWVNTDRCRVEQGQPHRCGARQAWTYWLLKAVLNTAVDDELIRRNPCRIKGAGTERSPERPTVTIEQVYAIAGGVRPWFKALVLLAAFTGLRWGELIALRRRHLDLDGDGVVKVRGSVAEVDGKFIEGPTKSEAGRRDVAIPEVIVPELRAHLDEHAQAGDDGRVFVGPTGAIPRRTNFQAT